MLFPTGYCDCQYPDNCCTCRVTNGDSGAWVAAGRAGVVVSFVGLWDEEVTIVFWVIIVVNGTGAAFPRWDVLPVLKTLSEPYWFDTVSLTS